MNTILKYDFKKRKKYLENISKKHRMWILRRIGYGLLEGLAVIIFISFMILMTILLHSAEDTFEMQRAIVCGLPGVTMGGMAYLFSVTAKHSAKYKCALPFSSYINGNFTIEDDYVMYTFWIVSEYPIKEHSKKKKHKDEDMFTYKIYKRNIVNIDVNDNNICTITGSGSVNGPLYRIDNEFSEEGERIVIKEFSFLTCFDNNRSNEILLNLVDPYRIQM